MSIRIQERDQYLLELLASDFLLLTREQIQQLIPRGVRRTNQRLALLTSHGYLAKKEPEDALSPSLTIYYLGENAANTLTGNADDIKARRTRARNFGDSYLRHLHLINSAHIKFVTAQAHEYHFVTWVSSDNSEWEHVPGLRLRPDGFLRFRKNQQEFCYFIEVDRGTERGESIRKKIAEYHNFDLAGGFWQSFKRDWFRVLFIVSEESRCKTLLKLFPSDTFWVAPAAEILSKRLFDGYWISRNKTLLSLSQELDPRRRERIVAQKEAQLHLVAPEPREEPRQQVRTQVASHMIQSTTGRLRALPWVFWLRIGGIIAGGTAAAAAGVYLYGIGAQLIRWQGTTEQPHIFAQAAADPRSLLIWLGGCILAILIIVVIM